MTAPETAAAERGWRALYLLGGTVAFVAVAGMLSDIALTMLPGWGAASVPTSAQAWLDQFALDPLLGMRNLDLLNITLSVVALPMYAALLAAHRRAEPGLALIGFVVVAVGTALFVSANAALPMLELSRRWAEATDLAARASLLAAADALLARGAHGSFGAYPGFLLSEIGTLLMSVAMLRGGVFGRTAAWIGIVGVTILAVYTTAYTFVSGTNALIMAVAIPGGLLMIAWHVMVGLRLLRLARG